MRRRVTLILGAAVAALLAQPVEAQESAPQGWIVVAQDSVRLTEMYHCWEAPDAAEPVTICSHTFMPPDSVYGEERSVGPGELVELRFAVAPHELWVTRERIGTDAEIEIPAGLTIEAPGTAGHYLYRIGATWPRGNVTWAFWLRVVEGT